MTWAAFLHVNKPLAYIVLSPRCCVPENVSIEAVQNVAASGDTFPAFIITQFYAATHALSGVSHHCILAQALRHRSKSQHACL